MARVLFLFALMLAAVSAFVTPSSSAVGPAFARTSSTPMKMVPVEATEALRTVVTENSQLLATSSDDFGGYFIPVLGLALLGSLILYLSPPLSSGE